MVNTQTLAPPGSLISLLRYSDPSSSKNYRPDIDGLRAIAVLAVVGFHAGIPWLRGGFVGVDVFFVISGYLICSIIYREISQDEFSIARFYGRRFKRIIPALSVVLVFCLVFGALVLSPYEVRKLGDSVAATSLSISNFLFAKRTDYFAGLAVTNPLLMTWSLAVEEQFYLVFPLLMLLFGKKNKRALLLLLATVSAVSFLCSIYFEFKQPAWNFYFPVTRAWELGAGTLLAVWQSGRLNSGNRSSWKIGISGLAGMLMIIGSFTLYSSGMRFPGYEAIPPVLGSILILASEGSLANRFLALRPVVAIGLISYSLYLWHWPLLSFAEIMSARPLRPPTVMIVVTIAFAAATGSYFFVEKPFRSKSRAGINKVLLSYGACILFIGLLGGIFRITHGLPARYPQIHAIENAAGLSRPHPCNATGSYLILSDQCVPKPSAAPALALLGDSHAESLWGMMQPFAASRGWHLITLTRQGCPPTAGTSVWSPLQGEQGDYAASCRKFNRAALDYVLSRADIQVVLLAGKWAVTYIPDNYEGDPSKQTAQQNAKNFRLGLRNEIAALEAAGKQVIVMEDVPAFPFDPVESVRNQQIRLRRIFNRMLLSQGPEQGDGTSELRSLSVTDNARLATEQIEELKRADALLTVVDPKQALCNSDRCYFANGLDLYYWDPAHLSIRGAMRILPLLPNLNEVGNITK